MYISGELRCCYGFLDLLYNRLSFKRSFLTYGVVAAKNKQKMGFKIRNFLQYLRRQRNQLKLQPSFSKTEFAKKFCQKMLTSFSFLFLKWNTFELRQFFEKI